MATKIALAGNPNCGKTTLFNNLTGANQTVGNWPGVTVEKKSGKLKGHDDVEIQDLPGIYSLSPYSMEEIVTRKYLVDDKPDVILNIIDGTNIERNLYLTTQLVEIGIPVVLAVNMMDVVEKNGDSIDTKKLGKELGCAAIEISALKGTNTIEAAELCIKTAQSYVKHEQPHVFRGSVEHAIAHIEESIETLVPAEQLRWYAVKVFERDSEAVKSISIPPEVAEHIEEHIRDCEAEEDDDAESIITSQRYIYIQNLIDKTVHRAKKTGELSVSDKIDRVVTNRILGLPIFVVVMFLVYWIACGPLGSFVTDWTNDVLVGEIIGGNVNNLLVNAGASDAVISLVVDGIIGGLGAPIGFVPQMAILFFLMAILEDCGYMARVAFVMDRIFRRFGLSGKSFIPFMISTGCGVPGIMSTRTIESEKDRRMTIITTTLMPCGAKLPVIALVAGYILHEGIVAPCMYFMGIGLVIVYCIILKKTKMFAGDPVPFVMELPFYHFPGIKGLLMHTWERCWAFIKKAGTILFACCVVMWFLGSFGFAGGSFGMVDTDQSLLASIGGVIAPLFAPLGFGTWQAVASSLSGFVAKEGILSTMSLLSSLGVEVEEYAVSMHDAFSAFFPTNIAAISFLVFNCFDSPCLAAISTTAKEIGSRKFFWFAIIFQNVSAYCIALIVYQIGGLILGQVAFGAGTVAAVIVLAVILYLLLRRDPNKARATAGTVAGQRS